MNRKPEIRMRLRRFVPIEARWKVGDHYNPVNNNRSQKWPAAYRSIDAALDSSPLWGAGRVEDTYNLVGHALKKVMRVVADQRERALAEAASEAGVELVCGSSLKTALDRGYLLISSACSIFT